MQISQQNDQYQSMDVYFSYVVYPKTPQRLAVAAANSVAS